MPTSKLSISVKDNWLEFIESYKQTHNIRTRSEVIARGLEALKQQELMEQYHLAFKEWADSGQEELWDVTVGDGLD